MNKTKHRRSIIDGCIKINNYVRDILTDIEVFIHKKKTKTKDFYIKLNGTEIFHPFIIFFEHFFGN
jgi:hypothetical protein